MGNKFSRLKPPERGCRFDKARVSVVHIFGLPAFLHGTDLSEGGGRQQERLGRCDLVVNRGPRATARTESRTSSHAVEARSSFSSCKTVCQRHRLQKTTTSNSNRVGPDPEVHVFWLEASEGALHNFRRQRPDGATEPKEEPTRTK